MRTEKISQPGSYDVFELKFLTGLETDVIAQFSWDKLCVIDRQCLN